MLSYIIRRLILMVFVIIGITLVLFGIMYLVPADPARAAAGYGAGQAQIERIRKDLGLDKPAHIQYLTYMWNLLHGNLGISVWTRKPVLMELKIFLPATLELAGVSMLLNLLISFPLGVASALRPGRLVDTLSRLFAAVGVGVPVFVVGLLAQYLFYGRLHLLPFGGRLPIGALPPDRVTGLYTIDTLLARDLPLFKDALAHLLMPAVVLTLPRVAFISRVTRSSMLDVLAQDYVRTARAKGLAERKVIWVHTFRNALLVPLTMLGLQIGWMLGGAVLVESVFSWAGLGFFAYNAVQQHDFVVIMGVTLLTCSLFVFSNLAVDILYSYVDPRISY